MKGADYGILSSNWVSMNRNQILHLQWIIKRSAVTLTTIDPSILDNTYKLLGLDQYPKGYIIGSWEMEMEM